MKHIKLIFLFILVFLYTNIKAQNYTTLAEVISAGGGVSSGGNYENFGVIGETFVAHSVTGGNYNTSMGFLNASDIFVKIDEENFNEQTISIFPNPAFDKLNIEFTDNINKIEKITLSNMLGQTVYTIKGKKISSDKMEIDISGFSSGVYTLKIKIEDGEVNKKFTVVR